MKYLYLVKSRFQNYATYGEPFAGRLLPELDWTKDRLKAVHFTSKESAQFLADLCTLAEARIVRVKR